MIYRGAESTKTYRLKRYSVKIEPIENRLHAWNRGKKKRKKTKKRRRIDAGDKRKPRGGFSD